MEKKVLLFSGGFDSMLQEYLIKPDVLLYVDMHTSYAEKEIEFLKTLPEHYQKRLIIKSIPLGEYEKESKYLPYRNLLLGTIAMQYGQHVYFGFNASDDAPDKDSTFLRRTTSLFRHLNKNAVGDMGWGNKKFSFNAPFFSATKTVMVKMCIGEGMPSSDIQRIRTCYDSESTIGCGVCRPCINKAIALLNNGIYEDFLFDTPVTVTKLKRALEETLSYMEEGHLPITYINEIRTAIKVRQEKE